MDLRGPDQGFWYSFTAIFILSCSVLILEISFSHLFSATLQHYLIFGVVGSTVFGLGIGGFLSYQISFKFPSFLKGNRFFIIFILLFAFLTLTLLYLVTHFAWRWYSVIPLIILPYTVAGILLSTIYKNHTSQSHLLYYADLSGASIGSLLSILLLNGLRGPINVIFIVAGLLVGVTLIFAWRSRDRGTLVFLAFLFVVLISLGWSNIRYGLIKLDYSRAGKNTILGMSLKNKDRDIIDTRWDAYSRVDLIRDKIGGDFSRLIYINGGTQATMLRFDGRPENLPPIFRTLNFFPFFLPQKENILIIGSGGGMEVVMALLGGSGHVTAVEINPLVVKTVLDYSRYNGGIYRYRDVDVFVDEGRSFLKRSGKKYDVILLPLVFSNAMMSELIFREDYLHTIDAFRDYWRYLRPGGRLVIVINSEELLTKLISTALSLLNEEGLSLDEAFKHLVALEDKTGLSYSHLLMLKKGAFLPDESVEIERLTENLNFTPFTTPLSGPGHPYLSGLGDGSVGVKEWLGMSTFNIKPATDDSPFFFNLEKGVPWTLVLFSVITISISLVLILLFFLQKRVHHDRERRGYIIYFILYFIALGIGYMLIEVSLAQQFILFLGYPTLSLSIVLFGFLLSSGLGSLLSPYLFKRSLFKRVFIAGISIVILLLLYHVIISSLFELTLTYPIGLKSIISLLIIFPLGFFMGIPFPTGLKMLKGFHPDSVAWMWGVNGVSSFIGSLLPLIIAFKGGFSMALLSGVVPYLVAAMISYKLPQHK